MVNLLILALVWFNVNMARSDGKGKSVHKLVDILNHDHGFAIPSNFFFSRTYAGWSQRSCGAWSWWLQWRDDEGLMHEVGSQYPVTELIHRKFTVDTNIHKQTHLDPVF